MTVRRTDFRTTLARMVGRLLPIAAAVLLFYQDGPAVLATVAGAFRGTAAVATTPGGVPLECAVAGDAPWIDRIGTPPVVYDAERAAAVIRPRCQIEVLDSGLAEGRGLIAVPHVPLPDDAARDEAEQARNSYRLIVADAWEGLYAYSLEQHLHAPKLPDVAICPAGECADVDHRGVVFARTGHVPRFLLVETHQQRIAERDPIHGKFIASFTGRPIEGITDAALLGTGADDDEDARREELVVTTVPRPVDPKSGLHPRGLVGQLRRGGELIAFVDGMMDRPVGVAYSPCTHRVYVTDAAAEQTTWYYFTRSGDTWQRTGTLGSQPADRGATLPVMQGIALGACTTKTSAAEETIFAAGPRGLYVFHSDGTLLARYVLSERVAALTWGIEGEPADGGDGVGEGSTLYMTIGHRIARLRTNGGPGAADARRATVR